MKTSVSNMSAVGIIYPSFNPGLLFLEIKDDGHPVKLVRRQLCPIGGNWIGEAGRQDTNPFATYLRELEEETGMKLEQMQQLYTVGTPGRDPRFRTVSVIYYTVVDAQKYEVRGADDAAEAQWFDVKKLQAIAFDHKSILEHAIRQLNK